MDYKNINDYETIYMIREHNDYYLDILLKKYMPLIKSTAHNFHERFSFLHTDYNELVEEGSLSFYKAVESYNDNHDVKFATYLKSVLDKRYVSYFRTLGARKNCIEYVDIDSISLDIKYSCNYVEEEMNLKELYDKCLKIKGNLGLIDSCIFELTYNGFKPLEISKLLDMSINNIRSRQYRIRKKLKEITL